jgi:hypothetical protein
VVLRKQQWCSIVWKQLDCPRSQTSRLGQSAGGQQQQGRRWWFGGGNGAAAVPQQLPLAARSSQQVQQHSTQPDLPPEARQRVAGLLERLMGADARAAEAQQRALSRRE